MFEHIFVLLLLLLLAAGAGAGSSSEPADPCAGRRIHIRNLPSRFNTDLLASCSSFPISGDGDTDTGFCTSIANNGLGPLTYNRTRSWYRTDPLLLELLFHRRLSGEYPCISGDPSAADAIFLPYYAALDALPFLHDPDLYNHSSLHGVDLHRFLVSDEPQIWNRFSGHDHFLVLAGPAWDFSQDMDADPVLWGTSFLRRPEFLNLTVLAVESRPQRWQERAIPHPTSFHPATLRRLDAWISRARRSRRDFLMLFAGGGGGGGSAAGNIRASIRSECENRTDVCAVVDCSGGSCSGNPIRFMPAMLRARFCLQPPGDTPARRSTFDAIVAGCVPVFFEEISAMAQYEWHLPTARMEEFSVFVPKEEVVFGGVRVADVLSRIPAAEVGRMREKVLEIAPRVVYRRHGSSAGLRERMKDAVDVAVDGALRRIRRRVAALSRPDWVVADDVGDEYEE